MPYLPLNTGSLTTNADGSNRTGVSLSTQIVVRVGTQAVGAIKSLNIRETRDVAMVDELGTDGHIDSAPTKSTSYTVTVSRTRFDRLRVTEAFSRGFLHAKSQRVPFDIDIFDRWGENDDEVMVTTLRNCWITSISYELQSDNWIISDSMDCVFEDISTNINGNSAATGGSRNLKLYTDAQGVERDTDRGSRRGSMDVAGVLTDTLIEL